MLGFTEFFSFYEQEELRFKIGFEAL
jgi:hypothetical protein